MSYKRKSVFRPKRLDFSLDTKLTSKGHRYRIQVSNLHKSDITALREPAKWSRIKINDNVVLLHTRATHSTDFQQEGEIVMMLKFRDGRTLRIYNDDMTLKDLKTLKRVMCYVSGNKHGGRR